MNRKPSRGRTCWMYFAAVWIVLCLAMPQITFQGRDSIHPFFSWRLFSDYPRVMQVIGLKIERCGEKVFDPPIDVYKRDQFAPTTSRMLFYRRLEGMAREYMRGEISDIRPGLKQLIETGLLNSKNCTFNMYLRYLDIMSADGQKSGREFDLGNEARVEL